jgi:Trp operon repressor
MTIKSENVMIKIICDMKQARYMLTLLETSLEQDEFREIDLSNVDVVKDLLFRAELYQELKGALG